MIVWFCVAAPLATIPLPEAVGFIPAVQGIIFLSDLTTAVWLFAQVSLTRSWAVLALASAYLFSALIDVAHTLTFPGAFALQGLLGAGLQTNGWLYIIWHFSYPAAVTVYVLLKDKMDTTNIRGSTRSVIFWGVVGVVALVCGIVWGLAIGDKFIPALFLDRFTYTPLVPYSGGFNLLICGIAFLCLLFRKSSILDELLTVSIAAATAEMAWLTFVSPGRYHLGWYLLRLFGVVCSSTVFLALFTELTGLYSNIAIALATVSRERDSKLLNAEAATAAIAHEIRQPLTGIAINLEAGIALLENTPPDLIEAQASLQSAMQECDHLSQTIDAVRKLFRKTDQPEQPIDLNKVIVAVLRSRRRELAGASIEIRQELMGDLPLVRGHRTQIEEVVVNLIDNAADAMGTIGDRSRVLTVRTRSHGHDAVFAEIQDTGPGIDPARLSEIFDPFVTTKSKGMGLGLAICRRIIVSHGGELTASSDGKNGATFQFVLPASRQESRSILGFSNMRKLEHEETSKEDFEKEPKKVAKA